MLGNASQLSIGRCATARSASVFPTSFNSHELVQRAQQKISQRLVSSLFSLSCNKMDSLPAPGLVQLARTSVVVSSILSKAYLVGFKKRFVMPFSAMFIKFFCTRKLVLHLDHARPKMSPNTAARWQLLGHRLRVGLSLAPFPGRKLVRKV